MREKVVVEGATHRLVMDAQAVDDRRWFGREYTEHERDTRRWEGTGVLMERGTANLRPFLFSTYTWNDGQPEWKRSLERALFSVADGEGRELFPQTMDRSRFSDALVDLVQRVLNAEDEFEVLPRLRLKPLQAENLVEEGVIGMCLRK